EGFCDLSGMENFDLKKWGEDLSAFIWKATRMPVSIGIASTKTLAKMAFSGRVFVPDDLEKIML
ncbi:MAG: hypothetical protein K6C10_10310, partial [Prevotella sp.]|nr:hypothetical protein [Prevotella sp.]